ncbi:hypothetical protein F511_10571 [Dorcoceras hygrometricum]|uniref:Chromophore lyase CRL, chloroplastic n=1 Tax=Dorcoceras hygrometricum TaxID=472368 RepID=A0A2Z7CNV1_9LAMI|nr:hypothetical protein F511_10571 [Dorcoceras hygrometricum]
MCTGSASGSGADSNGWNKARGVVLKALVLIGGALLLKRVTKSTTRWDHTRIVADSLAGEKFSREQASRDPDNYFNIRRSGELLTNLFGRYLALCLIVHAVPDPFYLQFFVRFFMVKPCSKEMKCDVELSTHAIRDAEEYRNFCDRSNEQRPQPDEVIGDIAEHLTTIYLKRCERGKRCLYEGSTPGDGFPDTWNGASYCTSELAVLKNNEIHKWDKGYDEDGNQVWGVKGGPYVFKPATSSSFSDPFAPLTFPKFLEKKIEGSFVLQD